MPDQLDTRKVSLEDVLRLKRLERPEPAFWDQFERQLREKQLAAIVAKRPWWQLDFGRVMAGVARARVPVGAAAVLTLTFLVVREYRTPVKPVEQATPSEGVIASSQPVSNAIDAALIAEGNSRSSGSAVEIAAIDRGTSATLSSASETPVRAASVSYASASAGDSGTSQGAPTAISQMIPWIGDAIDASTNALVSGVTRSLEPTLVSLRDASIDVPSSARSRALQVSSASSASLANEEPLAKLAGPSNSQRARLATYVAAAFKSDSDRSANGEHRARERAISRMSDDELYSSVSRVGVAGTAGGGLRLNF